MGNPPSLIWVFIPMREGRLLRHPVAFETFAEAQEAFKRHTGVDWMDSFLAYPSSGESYPGEITEGPARGSKILPAYFEKAPPPEPREDVP